MMQAYQCVMVRHFLKRFTERCEFLHSQVSMYIAWDMGVEKYDLPLAQDYLTLNMDVLPTEVIIHY